METWTIIKDMERCNNVELMLRGGRLFRQWRMENMKNGKALKNKQTMYKQGSVFFISLFNHKWRGMY